MCLLHSIIIFWCAVQFASIKDRSSVSVLQSINKRKLTSHWSHESHSHIPTASELYLKPNTWALNVNFYGHDSRKIISPKILYFKYSNLATLVTIWINTLLLTKVHDQIISGSVFVLETPVFFLYVIEEANHLNHSIYNLLYLICSVVYLQNSSIKAHIVTFSWQWIPYIRFTWHKEKQNLICIDFLIQ